MRRLILGIIITLNFGVFAQTEEPQTPPQKITPIIESPDEIKLGEKILLNAGSSNLIPVSSSGIPNYSWILGDKTLFGKKVQHVFKEPGKYKVRLNIKQGRSREYIEKDILVYDREGILITDKIGSDIPTVEENAAKSGVYLHRITTPEDVSDLSSESIFIQKFQEKLEILERAEFIIFYSEYSQSIYAFAKFWNALSQESRFDLKSKLLIQIISGSPQKVSKRTFGIYETLSPEFILITRKSALDNLFKEPNQEEFLQSLESQAIEFFKVDKTTYQSSWLPMSMILEKFIKDGLSANVLYIFLAVPFIAFLITFFRQFIGVSTFGVFAPLMLTLAFLVLGLKFGLLVLLVVMFVSSILRKIFDFVDLLYIPKVSLLLSFIALSLFLVLGLSSYLGLETDIGLAIFPMMMISTISEKFISSQSTQGLKSAFIAALETVLVAILAYFFVNWGFIKNIILEMPELIIFPLLGNFWLARFTGLRISEYIRFRNIFKEDSQE